MHRRGGENYELMKFTAILIAHYFFSIPLDINR